MFTSISINVAKQRSILEGFELKSHNNIYVFISLVKECTVITLINFVKSNQMTVLPRYDFVYFQKSGIAADKIRLHFYLK